MYVNKLTIEDRLRSTSYSKSYPTKVQLNNLIGCLCRLCGYCFAKRSSLLLALNEKLRKFGSTETCSRRQFYRYLSELEDEGKILRTRHGNIFLIWTAETYPMKEVHLKAHPVKYIGTKKLTN